VIFTAHKDIVNSNLKYKNLKIMKKSIFAIGLLSLVMVLTSFTTPETNKVTVNNTTVGAVGAQSAGGNVKLDAVGAQSAGGNVKLDAVGAQSAGGNVKLDAVGAQSAGGNVKLD
jgi:hypothetical protein